MSPKEIAAQFKTRCQELGFSYFVQNEILMVSKSFSVGDSDAFVECDMNGPYLLDLVPATRAGSVWGTDGGSVGGYSAVKNGSYCLKKSGCAKRILKLL